MEYRDISSPEQILSLQAYEDRLMITTDLPFYRSVVGYTIGNSPDGNDTIELSLSSQIDLSLDHQQKIVVETDSLEDVYKRQPVQASVVLGVKGISGIGSLYGRFPFTATSR